MAAGVHETRRGGGVKVAEVEDWGMGVGGSGGSGRSGRLGRRVVVGPAPFFGRLMRLGCREFDRVRRRVFERHVATTKDSKTTLGPAS